MHALHSGTHLCLLFVPHNNDFPLHRAKHSTCTLVTYCCARNRNEEYCCAEFNHMMKENILYVSEFGELFAAGSADLREKQCCGNNTLFTSWDSYKVFFFMNQRYMFLSTFEHNRTQTPQRNTFWNDKQWEQRTADVKGPSKENIFASLRTKWIVKNTKKSMTSHLKQLIPKVFVQYWTIISPNI